MNPSDFEEFSTMWSDTHEVMASGKVFTNRAMTMIFETLEEYPLSWVSKALAIHRKKSKFAPTPSDIIEIMQTGSKHIGADEAWAIVLRSFDESLTVVVTPEIMEARDAILDIYESGDAIAARMGFREAYNRIIASSSYAPAWFISAGSDKENRVDAINKAVQQGRLPKTAGSEYQLGVDKPTSTVNGLIESAHAKAQKSNDKEFKETALRNIGALKAMLEFNQDDGVARREEERKAFELHRQVELAKVEQKLGGVH